MAATQELDVLVVGAGPVGLFSALCLARRGLRVRIVDTYQRSALHSYALALHPESVRLLDEAGVADELTCRGHRISQLGVYRAEECLARLDLANLSQPDSSVLIVEQPLLEAALEKRLREAGVDVQWRHQVLFAEDRGEYASVSLASTDTLEDAPEASRVHASFVLGADGRDSLVRRMLGFEFRRVGGPQTYRVLEFEMAARLEPEIKIVLSPGFSDVLWPIAENRGRWGLQIDDRSLNADGMCAFDQMIRSRAPWFSGQSFGVLWNTTLQFDQRLVDSFGHGRIWLAGDAAHAAGPIGVQSMNVGLKEGHDLARRLAAILKDGASHELLTEYNLRRKEEWSELLAPVDHSSAALSRSRVLPCLPASGADLHLLLSQIHTTPPDGRKEDATCKPRES